MSFYVFNERKSLQQIQQTKLKDVGYKLILILSFSVISFAAFAQSKYTVSGTVKDKNTGESLIGATISITGTKTVSVMSNEHGFYSLTVPEGTYVLTVVNMGYHAQQMDVVLDKSKRYDFALDENAHELQEVTVTVRAKDDNVTNTQVGMEKMEMKDIAQIPVLMGERDILKVIQLTPGIKPTGEGNAGFYVRGGGADQNLILLDNALVYNASHLMGFFSTFNSDAVKDVTVYKGAMPAQYGGRLSSALDIVMNEGNNKEYHVSGGIGLISSRINVEGPIQKEKSSFLISGRRTYADLIAKASGIEEAKDATLYFYDLNAKANYILSDRDRIYLSGYFGRDKLGASDLMGIEWGNATATLRWNHILNERIFSNTSFIFSDYDYKVSADLAGIDNQIHILSRIRDWSLKQDFQFFANPENSFRFGLESTYHTVLPGQVSFDDPDQFEVESLQKKYSWENALYGTNTWKISDKLSMIYGLRLSSFSVLGAGDFYTLDGDHEITDTITYKTGDFVKTYLNLEPRLSIAYRLDDKSSVKAAYARTTQNMHLVSNSSISTPVDRWVPSSNNIKPEIADQVSLGYFRNFCDNMFEFSVEGYYKNLQNQIDYKDGAEVQTPDAVETELLYGKGRAYGVEFFLKKKYGRFNGWIGYTLSRTEKRIDGINNDGWYPAKQDRTHDISIVGIYELNKKWKLSAAWVYYTGDAVTFPSGKYTIDDQVVMYYTERNGYRAPDYHRLDLGATCVLKDSKKFYSELAFSLFNAYGRENAYMIDFRDNDDDKSRTDAYQYSLFRFVPSVSWNFKF